MTPRPYQMVIRLVHQAASINVKRGNHFQGILGLTPNVPPAGGRSRMKRPSWLMGDVLLFHEVLVGFQEGWTGRVLSLS